MNCERHSVRGLISSSSEGVETGRSRRAAVAAHSVRAVRSRLDVVHLRLDEDDFDYVQLP